ncbi:ribonuclease H2, subunit C [Lophiotrema nucula]|uniref:Ribonuclease H2, subunit C n=1 Tax=Lophiotrema nucula TaxID=690887 RepID=A0A6A5ZQD4_9PLEO|nr:ribonuclease H2, subunit C [Lophiotrema nucula]
MLAIQSSTKSSQKCTPNLLPARLNHNGPVNDTERYWKPERTENEKNHAYFRGRHLHGTSLALPANYTGAVLQITDKDVPTTNSNRMETEDNEEEDDEESQKVEVKLIEQVGEFDEFMIWGHGGSIDASEDTYARAIKEWIGFSEAMHIEPQDKKRGRKD